MAIYSVTIVDWFNGAIDRISVWIIQKKKIKSFPFQTLGLFVRPLLLNLPKPLENRHCATTIHCERDNALNIRITWQQIISLYVFMFVFIYGNEYRRQYINKRDQHRYKYDLLQMTATAAIVVRVINIIVSNVFHQRANVIVFRFVSHSIHFPQFESFKLK